MEKSQISDQEIQNALEQGQSFIKNISKAILRDKNSIHLRTSNSNTKPSFCEKGSANNLHAQFLKPKEESMELSKEGVKTSYATLELMKNHTLTDSTKSLKERLNTVCPYQSQPTAPTNSKGLTKLAILANYDCPQMLCLALQPC